MTGFVDPCAQSKNERVFNKATKIMRKYLLVSVRFLMVMFQKSFKAVLSLTLWSSYILISMILEGGEPSGELSAGLLKASVNLSQLIKFNSVKQKRRDRTEKYRHSKNNEPLLPVLIGLREYSRTGKKKLIDCLAAEGVSISYDHFMYLRRSISTQVCMKYQANGLVFPVDLKKGRVHTSCYQQSRPYS